MGIEEKIREAIERTLRVNGYGWKSDDANDCNEIPNGETPYTYGQELIDSLLDLVRPKKGHER